MGLVLSGSSGHLHTEKGLRPQPLARRAPAQLSGPLLPSRDPLCPREGRSAPAGLVALPGPLLPDECRHLRRLCGCPRVVSLTRHLLDLFFILSCSPRPTSKLAQQLSLGPRAPPRVCMLLVWAEPRAVRRAARSPGRSALAEITLLSPSCPCAPQALWPPPLWRGLHSEGWLWPAGESSARW